MEEITFKINLECTQGPDGYPPISISVADTTYWSGKVIDTDVIEFTAKVAQDTDFYLVIDFEGNDAKKYKLDSAGFPTNASVLTIIDIVVDDIRLGEVIYNLCELIVDPSEKYLEDDIATENCLDFSIKAKWTLPLAAPVYIWLLQNL